MTTRLSHHSDKEAPLGWYLGVDELPDLVLLEKEVGVHEVTCNNKAQPRVRAASLSSQRGQKCINV